MKVKEYFLEKRDKGMTRSEEESYMHFLIYGLGYPDPAQIMRNAYEESLLLESIADYKGGYPDEYIFKE